MTIEVSLPDIEGYDVTVTIHDETLERRIQAFENQYPEALNHDGLAPLKLSRFATVEAEPTPEKWDELAAIGMDDRDTESDEDDAPSPPGRGSRSGLSPLERMLRDAVTGADEESDGDG